MVENYNSIMSGIEFSNKNEYRKYSDWALISEKKFRTCVDFIVSQGVNTEIR